MHDARLIANKILECATKDGNALTPMQLLKLVYIAHGWMLGLYSVPLVRDRVEAWKYGPVIPKLYHSVKNFGSSPVTGRLADGDESEEMLPIESDLIRQIYESYGDETGVALSRLTHQPGSPWHEVYEDGVFGIEIPIDIIEDHYRRLAE